MKQSDLPVIRTRTALLTAAKGEQRVHLKGVVAGRGVGYSGTYRNTWLQIQTRGGLVEVTAALHSPLGNASVGAKIELTVELNGLLDVRRDLFYGVRAKLLNLD